ncbi:hypothetical protein L7F22_015078 [Adiantum nelumboides]|nr:hypothetical protein [Adiantum nelumboides]
MFYTASSSPSLDQKLADGKGSCPGTFFHLFDWNCHDSHHGRQLFGHKPNPFGETTLDPTVKTCNDEVLPCTLVTNNINRCELSTANQTSLENCLPKVQIPKKKKKKSPNVVAKLMGLETMPSPEPCRRQRRPLDSQSPNLMQTPANAVYFPNIRVRSIKQRNLEGDETLEGRSIRLKSSRKKLLSDLSCKQGSENRARGNQHSPAQMQLEYAPVVSFQTQNREPNKLSLAARPASTASNFEGTQINIKHNEERLSKTQSLKMECVLSPAKTQANFKMVRGSEYTAAQASCTAVRVRAEKNKVGATSTSNSNVSPKLEETGQGQASKDNKYIKKDKCQVDCHSGHQPFSRKTDVNLTQGFKKTEQNSKQLCQLAGLKQAGARLQKFRSKLGASTLRESFEEPENLITQRNLSVDSTISRIQQADPSCSTKIISKHKRLSNHAKGASDKNGNIFKLQKQIHGKLCLLL